METPFSVYFKYQVMIEIHLYGKLRSLVSGSSACEDTVMMVDFVENETFACFVERLGLKEKDLGDCFINGNLAKKNYQMKDDDRIGLFPFNMVLLCGGQHLKGHGYTKEDVDVDYY
jgi:molybdopterin converting factor small subunit